MNFVESYFTTEAFGKVLTFAIFVVAGFDIGKYIPEPRQRYAWSVVAGVALLAGYVAITTPVVQVLGYDVYLDAIILGLGCGCIVAYLARLYPRFKMR